MQVACFSGVTGCAYRLGFVSGHVNGTCVSDEEGTGPALVFLNLWMILVFALAQLHNVIGRWFTGAMDITTMLTTPELQGFVALRSELPTDASFMLGFSAEAMALDDPALRAAIGGSFAKPLSEEQIEGTRDNMLGDSVLDAEPHPEIVLRSVEIGGDWPMLVARVEVALHGSTQVYDSLLEVRRDDERLSAEGSLVIRQTDFGITPMSVLGGLLGLQDPIGIRYRIVARASED